MIKPCAREDGFTSSICFDSGGFRSLGTCGGVAPVFDPPTVASLNHPLVFAENYLERFIRQYFRPHDPICPNHSVLQKRKRSNVRTVMYVHPFCRKPWMRDQRGATTALRTCLPHQQKYQQLVARAVFVLLLHAAVGRIHPIPSKGAEDGVPRSRVCFQVGRCGGHIAHAALHNKRAIAMPLRSRSWSAGRLSSRPRWRARLHAGELRRTPECEENAKGNNIRSARGISWNPSRGVRGKGKHTRWENASQVPNLCLIAALKRRRVMPDSGRGGEDVNVIKICQMPARLGEAQSAGPGGRAAKPTAQT